MLEHLAVSGLSGKVCADASEIGSIAGVDALPLITTLSWLTCLPTPIASLLKPASQPSCIPEHAPFHHSN